MEEQKQETTNDITPKITGIGGIFFFSDNPKETKEWYAKNLGLEINDWGSSSFESRNINKPSEIDSLQWKPFEKGDEYFSPSKKGTGFVQPLRPHQHWHIDISYINVAGTFYFLCSLLDGYSRYIVHWELRETMKEHEVENVVQRALEKFPGEKPRIISDNGPQFLARDFKEYIRLMGMTHVRTSPFYPQSNGKLERWHGSLKRECIRPACPDDVDDARRRITAFVAQYNQARLHSALGYVTPADKLHGLETTIFDERDRKLEEARARRQQARRAQREVA